MTALIPLLKNRAPQSSARSQTTSDVPASASEYFLGAKAVKVVKVANKSFGQKSLGHFEKSLGHLDEKV